MKQFHVIGVMSGTSLDGIDFAEIVFNYTDKWSFELKKCDTFPYPDNWIKKLQAAVHFSESEQNESNSSGGSVRRLPRAALVGLTCSSVNVFHVAKAFAS